MCSPTTDTIRAYSYGYFVRYQFRLMYVPRLNSHPSLITKAPGENDEFLTACSPIVPLFILKSDKSVRIERKVRFRRRIRRYEYVSRDTRHRYLEYFLYNIVGGVVVSLSELHFCNTSSRSVYLLGGKARKSLIHLRYFPND